MSITVKEALETEGMKRCKLVAGKAGRYREIQCIDTMEMPDIAPWLRKHELLMTTGYSIQNVEGGVVKLLKNLDEVEGAGLAVTTQFLGEISEEAKQIADILQMPLIEIPSDLPFIEMTTPLMKAIVDKQNQMLEFSDSMNKKFIDLEINGGGFQEIANVLNELTGYTTYIVNIKYEIVAEKRKLNTQEISLTRGVERLNTQKMRYMDIYEQLQDGIEQQVRLGSKEFQVIKKKIIVKRKTEGYVLLLAEKSEMNYLKMIALQHAINSAAIEFSKMKAMEESQQVLDNNLFLDLLSNNIQNNEEIYQRTKSLKWPEAPIRLLYMEVCSSEEFVKGKSEYELQNFKEEIVSDIKRIILLQGMKGTITFKSDTFTCIFSEIYDKKMIKVLAGNIVSQIGKKYNIEITVGISDAWYRYMDIIHAYQECKDAVKIGKIYAKQKIIFIQDVLVERIFAQIGNSAGVNNHIEKVLGALFEYDKKNKGNLVDTLEILIENMGAKNITAEQLHLHRNSLSYRLKKIESLTGISLEDSKNLLSLGLILKIRHFIV